MASVASVTSKAPVAQQYLELNLYETAIVVSVRREALADEGTCHELRQIALDLIKHVPKEIAATIVIDFTHAGMALNADQFVRLLIAVSNHKSRDQELRVCGLTGEALETLKSHRVVPDMIPSRHFYQDVGSVLDELNIVPHQALDRMSRQAIFDALNAEVEHRKAPPASRDWSAATFREDAGTARLDRAGDTATILVDAVQLAEGTKRFEQFKTLVKEAAAADNIRNVDVDLRVERVDSSALGVLVTAAKTLNGKGGTLSVIIVNEGVFAKFQEMRLNRVFKVTKLGG